MTMSDAQIWLIIALVGIGTYLIRLSFIGVIGNRPMPAWVLRHLRYTPVAVLPGLVAPLVLWPEATGGTMDLPRLLAAMVTILLGLAFKNVLAAIIGGAATLYLTMYILG